MEAAGLEPEPFDVPDPSRAGHAPYGEVVRATASRVPERPVA